MEKLFETAIFTRSAMLSILEELTEEQLAMIPEGHRNNIFWNIAHVMVTQQLLLYGLSGLPLLLDSDFIKRFTKGSTAVAEVIEEDLDLVRENLLPLSQRAQEDFGRGVFSEYKPYMTSTGIELKTIEEGISFSTYHDGIHLGVVLSLKKLV
jgi:hypothetical protein